MDKKQEILNRRQFFQKAVERTLPIIGFVSLGSMLQSCGDNLELSDSLSNSNGDAGSGNSGASGTSGNSKIPSDASGSVAGIEYVDLGLSVLWARCNIGAKTPTSAGKKYSPFVFEDGLNYDNYLRQLYLTFSVNLGSKRTESVSGSKFDRVTHQLGSKWCSPNLEHVQELYDNCEVKFYDLYKGIIDNYDDYTELGSVGTLFISKINGNSILFRNSGKPAEWSTDKWITGDFYYNSFVSHYFLFDPSLKSYSKYEASLRNDSTKKYLARPIVAPNSGAGGNQGGNNQGGGGSDNCAGNCYNNCYDDCYNSCSEYCEGDCKGLCEDSCYGLCEGKCTGTCEAQCRDNCDVKCDVGCSGWCTRVSI